MNCNEIRELMPELAAGLGEPTLQIDQHLRSCGECAAKLQSFRQTMAVLDEWQTPEPSPYFETRLQARLREGKMAKQPSGWTQWLRKPVLAVSFALMMVASVTLVRITGNQPTTASIPAAIEPGTAVGDLQALDKNDALYSDFDVLDDLQVQRDVTANP